MKTLRLSAGCCLLAVSVMAEEPARPPGAIVEQSRGIHFTLIPKAFVKNPSLEMTVNTQLTPFGRSLPEASPEHPVYYIAHDEGYRQMGDTVGGEHPPPPPELERHLIAALSERGYRPATPQSPPSLVLFFVWGSHNAMDREMALMFPEQAFRQQLERSMLIGGSAFRKREDERASFGSGAFDMSAKSDYLHYQALNDLYYGIVSAYDYTALAHNERRLAWRTTMTVNATGVNMTETLPALITSSSFYFGRATDEPVAIIRDVHRGTVTLGPLRILERVPDPTPPTK